MRRPAVDPWTRDQLVSQRNMMQGMAAARVPAAYPVPRIRLPRMLGGLKGSLPPVIELVAPTSAKVTAVSKLSGTASFTLADPAGASSAIIVVQTFHTFSDPKLKTLVVPAGWTLLGTANEMGGEVVWWALACDDPTTADLTFTWSDTPTLSWSIQAHYTYFYGSVGGSWSLGLGPHIDGTPQCDWATPTTPIWQQFGICSSMDTYYYVPPGASFSGGFGTYICNLAYPGTGTYDAAAFASTWAAGNPCDAGEEGLASWGSIGYLGRPGGRALVLGWSP